MIQHSQVLHTLSSLISNFNIEHESDQELYVYTEKARKTAEYSAQLRAILQQEDDFAGVTFEELKGRYNDLFTKFIDARVRTAELETLLVALDYKLSQFVEFVVIEFTQYDDPAHESLSDFLARNGMTPQHKIFHQAANDEKKSHLRLVK